MPSGLKAAIVVALVCVCSVTQTLAASIWARDYRYAEQIANRADSLVAADKLLEAEELTNQNAAFFRSELKLSGCEFSMRMAIGRGYLARGNKAEALRLFRSAKPGGGCGNGIAAQRITKDIAMAHVYDSSLNFPASFACYVDALPNTSLGGNLMPVIFGLAYSGGATFLPFIMVGYGMLWYGRRLRRTMPTD